MTNRRNVYVIGYARTPVGSFLGSLSSLNAIQLGKYAVEGALKRANIDPSQVEEFIFGNVLSANLGQNPARQVALSSGIPNSVPCSTINKVCASGMKAITLAAQTIALGDADIIVAGGTESMSNVPHYNTKIRNGLKYGSFQLVDGIDADGLSDAYSREPMGNAAELCASKYELSRESQDQYAIRSYSLAQDATRNGHLMSEIVEVSIQQKNATQTITEDDEVNKFQPEKLRKLKPVFKKDGTITPANASSLSDGASAVVLVSEDKLASLKLPENQSFFKIISYADAALEPVEFTVAPSQAIPKAIAKANRLGYSIDLNAIDYFEINEAFSAVALANCKILNLNLDKVNIYGGAVGIGHPLGCSGARITTALMNILNQKKASLGCAAICNGGGGASALILERIQQ